HVRRLPVLPVRRLARRRDQSLAVLAGGFREQLLRPKPEAAGVGVDRDLVAAVEPPLAELFAELEARVALLAPARLEHLVDAVEESFQVDPEQRGGDDPER